MKKFLLVFLAAFATFCSFSQSVSNPITFPKMSPPSPEAASLGRYGEFPVTLATGTPNVAIPIYEISSGTLKMPISISYHASGIRVNDVASRVGLGWSLQAGGVITRAVKGLPDDDGGIGYYSEGVPPATEQDNTSQCFIGNMVLLANRDGQPDDFFYSFGAKSGKFLYTNKQSTTGNQAIAVPIPQSGASLPLRLGLKRVSLAQAW